MLELGQAVGEAGMPEVPLGEGIRGRKPQRGQKMVGLPHEIRRERAQPHAPMEELEPEGKPNVRAKLAAREGGKLECRGTKQRREMEGMVRFHERGELDPWLPRLRRTDHS